MLHFLHLLSDQHFVLLESLVPSYVHNVHSSGSVFVFRGTFRIERTDGSHFDVRIPPFSLESNKDDKAPPAGYTF